MTSKPLLHPRTAANLEQLLTNPPHAVLLSGAPGIGKGTVAQWLAAQLLDVPIADHPYVLQLEPVDGKAIGIESIRELERMTTLKVPGGKTVARILVIHNADSLTTEAQNALLKTLEEPPQDTVIIMTASQIEALLPTIQSRLQTIELTPPAVTDVQTALEQRSDISADQLKQILALSGGLPGLAFALADNVQDHPLVVAAQTARKLLTQSTFERLCQVDALAKNKQGTSDVLYMLMQMSRAALMSSKSQRWHKVMQAAYTADTDLRKGAQAKLALTNLMLTL